MTERHPDGADEVNSDYSNQGSLPVSTQGQLSGTTMMGRPVRGVVALLAEQAAAGDIASRRNLLPVLAAVRGYGGGMGGEVATFTVSVGEDALDELRQRLAHARWPEPATVAGWSQGVPLDWLRDLCGYWQSGYDWRRLEDRLNGLPQFTTELDGLDVHFMHMRSPHPDALPLIVTHGWPGSVVEFLDVVEPLVDPVAHGEARDAFHVVCPSLPGFGFSAKPARVGMPAEQWVGSAGWITGPGHIAPGLSE